MPRKTARAKATVSTASAETATPPEIPATPLKPPTNALCGEPTFFALCQHKPGTWLTYRTCRSVMAACYLLLIGLSLYMAYDIRIISVRKYGYLIHEFDPWFNFRATQYLSDHGWHAFFHWFDRMSWYPIGRPVGTTIYPGMQITAVAIHRALAALDRPMSLNHICVLIPAWFGVLATLLLGAIAHELSRSLAVTTIAMLTFSIIPAHTMRSMAGEFDNECIAMTAMLLTFYLWIRALRTPRAWPVGVLAGLAYGYMAAAWGGFIFVLNMIAMHASVCAVADWVQNRYNVALLRAYSLFFIVGTAIATRVPPVGMSPFRSLEQLAGLLVFVGLWTLQVSEYLRRRAGVEVRSMGCLRIRSRVIAVAVGVLAIAAALLTPSGYFGPFSVRVRALFMRHTRTGNPLVDSVAEHHPTDPTAYLHFLNMVYLFWLLSFITLPMTPSRNPYGMLFLYGYSIIAQYFSMRMSRLILLAGPVDCVAAAFVVGPILNWLFTQLFWDTQQRIPDDENSGGGVPQLANGKNKANSTKYSTSSNNNSLNRRSAGAKATSDANSDAPRAWISVPVKSFFRIPLCSSRAQFVASLLVAFVVIATPMTYYFVSNAWEMAEAVSQPRIAFYAPVNGPDEWTLVDDYYKSYLWLRNHTPSDARVLAWWDYGYQITGIGNRTSLADGNTWNHEHIGTLGKLLTSPVKEAHSLIRHLADYVLIWAGQSATDLMKSPHMARIGNSVYHDICPDDPLCDNFGFYENDISRPTTMMRRSLLYHMHSTGIIPGISLDTRLFREVYTSKYGLVRIFKVMNVSKASKTWIADPANQVCSVNDPWICPGQYPPAPEIQAMIAKRLAFEHPSNEEEAKWKERYNKLYMERMRRYVNV